MKQLVKVLGITAITLPLVIGNTALADKQAKKRNQCMAKAAAVTGYNPKNSKKDKSTAKKAEKYTKEYNSCMNDSGKSFVKVPKF